MSPTGPVPTTVQEVVAVLRGEYGDAVRLSAREEILAELAEDAVTGRLHADTARFHYGSAHAYARAVEVLLRFWGEEDNEIDVHDEKQKVKAATREADLALMRCQDRQYRSFDPDGP